MAQTYSLGSVRPTSPAAPFVTGFTVAGRVLLALMFVLAGISKLGNIPGTAAFIASAGLPMPSVAAVVVGVFELVAGVALAAGWHARIAAGLLALFTVVATFTFHAYWSMPAEHQMVQQLMFMKNMAVAGAMLFIVAMGAGRGCLDARSEDR